MGEWNHGLFGCFDQCKTCILAVLFPCYLAGKIGESVGENCCLHGFFPCLPCRIGVRQKVRAHRGIERKEKDDHLHLLTIMEDMICLQIFGCCALIQEYNEMEIARN